MAYLFSFVKGLVGLVLAVMMTYHGVRLLHQWSKGIKKLAAFLLVVPPVLFLADYVGRLLTLGKLGDWGTLFVLLILLLVGWVSQIRIELGELGELRRVADALGLDFHRSLEVDPTLRDHPVLKKGFGSPVEHALVGRYHDVDTLMFNFGWEDISDDVPDPYFRTAVVFSDPDMEIPEFELHSAGLGHRVFGSLFRGHSVDLSQDPEFSKRYRLTGSDQRAVREFFGLVDRRALKDTKRTWAMSGKDHRVVIYADAMMDEEVKPELEDISGYLNETLALFEPLRRAGSR